MKLVCAYVPGSLRAETLAAINQHWPHPELIPIDPDDQFAYVETIAALWKNAEDFFVVEPDIVIRPDVVESALNCECEYGAFPYAWLTDVGVALGCTWFRSSFLVKYPQAMLKVQRSNVTWRQLDVVLLRHVLAREYGEQPHVHLPPVEHLNEAKQLLPEANPEPLMYVPNW